MSKLNEIKAKVVECVPEIMELKFGCEVLVFKTDPSVSDTVATFLSFQQEEPHNAVLFFHKESCPFINSHFSPKDYKILGREVTLADIFMTVSKCDLPEGYMFFNVNWRGNMELSGLSARVFEKWNFAETLSGQSSETIDFIHRFLFKE